MKLVQKAIVKKGNKFLILLRSPKAENFPNHWDFPGGKLEEGEDPFRGIEREVFEETALQVKALDVVGAYEIVVDGVRTRFTIYSAKIISGNVKLSHEHTGFKWATKEEILKLKIEPYIKLYFEKC